MVSKEHSREVNSVKIGDLVSPRQSRRRIYDLPSIEIRPAEGPASFSNIKVPRMIEKLFPEQTAVIIGVDEEKNPTMIQVLAPSGKVGWVRAETLRVVKEV